MLNKFNSRFFIANVFLDITYSDDDVNEDDDDNEDNNDNDDDDDNNDDNDDDGDGDNDDDTIGMAYLRTRTSIEPNDTTIR